MRKRFTPPILALLIVLILFTAISCKDKTCSHVWNDGEITTPATCKDEGSKAFTCTLCGEKKTEAVAITSDHKFETESETAATCTEKGSKTVKCSVCGKTETETIPLKTHDYVLESETAASCTVYGSKKYECSVCGEKKTEVVPMIAHNYVDNGTTAASCETKGSKNFKCSECSATTSDDIPALGHLLVYDNVITSGSGPSTSSLVAPTCKEDGKYKMKCARSGCGYVGEDQTLLKDEYAHNGSVIKYDTSNYRKATAASDGSLTVVSCNVCSVENKTVTTYIDNDLVGTWTWGSFTAVFKDDGTATLTIGEYVLSNDWCVLKSDSNKPYRIVYMIGTSDDGLGVNCYFKESEDNGWLGFSNRVDEFVRKTTET